MNTPNLLSLLLLIAVLFGCGGGEQQKDPIAFAAEQRRTNLKNEIDSLEKRVNRKDAEFERGTALQLVRAYQDFYNQNMKDTLSGEYLFRAASLSVSLKKPQQAINQLVTYYDTYKTASRRPEALYLVGFIYDSELQNAAKAEEFYKRVIEIYPENMWAEQARAALQFVGLSDEELIKKLEAGNQQ